MLNQTATPRSLTRLPFILILISASLLASSCATHKKVQVAQLLTPLAGADTARLIGEVKRVATVHSIHGKDDIVFEDTSFAEAGIAKNINRRTDRLPYKGPARFT